MRMVRFPASRMTLADNPQSAALPTSSEKGYSKYILEFNNEFLIGRRIPAKLRAMADIRYYRLNARRERRGDGSRIR